LVAEWAAVEVGEQLVVCALSLVLLGLRGEHCVGEVRFHGLVRTPDAEFLLQGFVAGRLLVDGSEVRDVAEALKSFVEGGQLGGQRQFGGEVSLE
jgi:hypothetical protein